MTIRTIITQTCNGHECGESRTIEQADSVNLGGWREIRPNKHLCPTCIRKALGES